MSSFAHIEGIVRDDEQRAIRDRRPIKGLWNPDLADGYPGNHFVLRQVVNVLLEEGAQRMLEMSVGVMAEAGLPRDRSEQGASNRYCSNDRLLLYSY